MTRHGVTWRGITWAGVTWYGITWHDVTWRDMAWHDVMTWHDMTWRDMTWHYVAWHDITGHDRKVDNKALVVWPFHDFRATAYKFRAFMSRNECLGNLKNLVEPEGELNSRNVIKGFADLKNINGEEISKIYKTQSPVPPSTCWTGSLPGFSRVT